MLAPREAPSLPRLCFGVHRGGANLQVGRGGRWGGVLKEARRHFKPAEAAREGREEGDEGVTDEGDENKVEGLGAGHLAGEAEWRRGTPAGLMYCNVM